MSIQNEVFDHLYRKVSGRVSARCDTEYNRKRFNRAKLALSCQNYFLGTEFFNETGAVGVTFVDQTDSIDRIIILRGGGINARSIGPVVAAPVDIPVGRVELKIFRSGSSKSQLSRISTRSNHFLSDGQGQPWELDWPVPMTLIPNEVLQVTWTQISATIVADVVTPTHYAANFYGVAVDPRYQCDADLLDDLCRQIKDTDQRPLYLNVKSDDSGGTITFDAIGADNREIALTQEVNEHLLVLGFRRNSSDYLPPQTTFRLASSDGRAFMRSELVVRGFEFYNAPDNGYFRFAVPHLLRKGQSLTMQLTSDTATARDQLEGEVNLLCVNV